MEHSREIQLNSLLVLIVPMPSNSITSRSGGDEPGGGLKNRSDSCNVAIVVSSAASTP